MASALTKRTAFAGALEDVKICPFRDTDVKELARRPGTLAEN